MPFPADIAVFQYYKGLSFGVLIGIALAWLAWRLPIHMRTRHTRKLRRQVLDMRRIEAGFRGIRVPNPVALLVNRVSLRERILTSAQQFWQDTAPRTPEQVARTAYERELMA